ncbi:MAG: hypothetical protein ACI9HU_001985 [Colwellia sp.]
MLVKISMLAYLKLNELSISVILTPQHCKNAKRIAFMFIVTSYRKAYLAYIDLYNFNFLIFTKLLINRDCYEYY